MLVYDVKKSCLVAPSLTHFIKRQFYQQAYSSQKLITFNKVQIERVLPGS